MEPQIAVSMNGGVASKPNGNGNNGQGRSISLANLIQVVVLAAGIFLSWQNIRDKIEFLETRVASLEVWKEKQDVYVQNLRERLISVEGRLTAVEANGWRPAQQSNRR